MLLYCIVKLKVKRLNDNTKLPEFAHSTDAGMDLFCTEKVEVKNNQSLAVSTGIAMQIPDGYVGLI